MIIGNAIAIGAVRGRGASVPTAPPVNTVAPVLSGSFFVGQTLTCSTGTWTSGGITYTYQWQNNTVDIGGATNSTYVLQAGDDGDSIRCVVTATNSAGSASEPSNALIAIQTALWLDASDLTTIAHTMGSVTQWADKSGSARNIGQPTGAAQPTTGVATINGLNAIRFDGSSDFLFNTSPFMYAAGQATIFAVHNAPAQTGGMIISETSTANFLVGYPSMQSGVTAGKSDDLRFYIRNSENVVLAGVETNASVFNGVPAISTLLDTGSVMAAYGDGVSGGGPYPYTRSGTMPLNSLAIGANRRSSLSSFFNGGIGEILVAARALSVAEMNELGNYLATKWGITWVNI